MIYQHFVTPGSWLFCQENLSWLQENFLSRQLPYSYRQFAAYCGSAFFQKQVAEVLLRSLIAIDCRRGHEGILPLDLGASCIFLDLHDPRFLRVPQEVKESESQLATLLRKGDTFVDGGANHGSFSLAAAGLVGQEGLVLAIEPQAHLANLVERTLRRTGIPFQVYPLALGSQSGSAVLFRPVATSGSAGLIAAFSAVSRHRSFAVPVARLDDLVRGRMLPGRVLWKLDIEGGELRCLQGAREFLHSKRPRVLMEINPRAMLQAGTTLDGLVTVLQQSRYGFLETHRLDEPRNARELRFTNERDHREIVLVPEETFGASIGFAKS